MKTLVRHTAFRVSVVVIAALGWLALSNHCAIGAVEAHAAKTCMTCHGSSTSNHAPSKNNEGVECCKVVRATLLTPPKSLVSFNQLLFAAFKYLVGIIVLPHADEQNGVIEWDTGPPGALSFSETVLQRSILAHAPPFLA
jgi:hypothetical protein